MNPSLVAPAVDTQFTAEMLADLQVDPIRCVARPGTRYLHLDGVCACFYGGPAPEMR